jgi:hypothetical protein
LGHINTQLYVKISTLVVPKNVYPFCLSYLFSIYWPKPATLIGDKYGLTVSCITSSALHFTTAGGQVALGHGAHAGHFVGGGHFTSGHLALGQGGHSPLGLLHLEQSKITGCCLGTDDFSTYLLKSGTGGHSLLSI